MFINYLSSCGGGKIWCMVQRENLFVLKKKKKQMLITLRSIVKNR